MAVLRPRLMPFDTLPEVLLVSRATIILLRKIPIIGYIFHIPIQHLKKEQDE